MVQRKNNPLDCNAFLISSIGFFALNKIGDRSNASDAYQTAVVERGDLIAIVGATGVVEAKQTTEINWQTTGRVEHVFAEVNKKVKAGEKLADLADNTLPQSVILAQSDLVTAKKNLEDLINSNTSSAEAYRNLLTAESDLRDAKEERDDWNYNGANWDRINSARAEFIRLEEELKIYSVELMKRLEICRQQIQSELKQNQPWIKRNWQGIKR